MIGTSRARSSTSTGSAHATSRKDGEGFTQQELRLFLEELCSELCRFRHMAASGLLPESVQVEREVPLGPACYGDLRVRVPDAPPYFVEIKFGMPTEDLLARLRAKYGLATAAVSEAGRLVLVVDMPGRGDPVEFSRRVRAVLAPHLVLEIWDEPTLLALTREHFHIDRPSITEDALLDIREAVSIVEGQHAFADAPLAEYRHDALREYLLWRFSFWRLRQIREARAASLSPRELVVPGLYRNVAVVIADLCSFSSFVRDTPDERVVRESLTSFFSKARHEVVHRGGMLENFVGDQILALFGLPDRAPGYIDSALDAAKALLRVGEAVSQNWQRQIDREQPSSGMHVGVAYGDVQIMPLRPSSRSHTTAIADVINVAARLMNVAGAGEIVVTNSFYLQLRPESRAGFAEMEPQDGRNVGRLRAWRFSQP